MDPDAPQEGTTPDPQTGDGSPETNSNGDGQESFDAAYVKKLRQENAGWRTRAQAAEAKVSEFEKSQLSESEKAQARVAEQDVRIAELEQQVRRSNLEHQVMAAAPKFGIDAAVVGLLDLDRLEVAEDGTIANLDDVLRDLVKAVQPRGSGGGGARPQEPATSMNDLIRQAAGRR